MLFATDEYKLSLYKHKELLQSSKSSDIILVTSTLNGKLYVKRVYKGVDMVRLFNAVKDKHIRNSPQIFEVLYDGCNTIVIEEYVLGYTAESVTLSKSAFYKVMLQIFASVEDLHSINIIHRDIKPENIIVTNEYAAYLIDFGISRFYSADFQGGDTTKLGTKGYASPEQFGFKQTDFRSDIYSLGKTMELLIKANDIHIGLKAVISKATAFDPDNRYQNIEQLRYAVLFAKYRVRVGAAVFTAALLTLALCSIAAYTTSNLPEKMLKSTAQLTTQSSTQNALETTTEQLTEAETTATESTTQQETESTTALVKEPVKLIHKADANSKHNNPQNILNTKINTDFLSGIEMPSGVDFMYLSGNEASKTAETTINNADVTVECVKADSGVTINLSDSLGHTDSAKLAFTSEELSSTDYSTHSFNVYVYFYDYNGDGITEILVSFTDAYQQYGKAVSTIEEANSEYGWGGSPSVNYNLGMAMLIEHTAEKGFYIYKEIIMPEGNNLLTAYQNTGVFVCMESGCIYEPKDGIIEMRTP